MKKDADETKDLAEDTDRLCPLAVGVKHTADGSGPIRHGKTQALPARVTALPSSPDTVCNG